MADMSSVDPSLMYIMLKGEPGTRKSTCALSYPRPQYWFSWDKKMGSIKIPQRNWSIPDKDIQFDDYSDWNTAKTKLEQFQLNCPFKTLIFDSLTSMADNTLNQTMKFKKGATRSSGAAAGKLVGGIPVNEMEDYNAESAALAELVSLTKDIHMFHKVTIILIAHVIQAEYKTATGETHMSRTIVTAGKRIAAKIPAYCSEVYHFNIESSFDVSRGGQYALLTEHTGDDFARTALPLEKKILFGNDPLYDKWIQPAIDKMKQAPQSGPVKF